MLKLPLPATDAGSVYLLEFVNGVRASQSRAPLDRLDRLGARGGQTLEAALGCRLDPAAGVMRFASSADADAVAAGVGLQRDQSAGTVELPPAIRRFARLLAVDSLGADPGRGLESPAARAGVR